MISNEETIPTAIPNANQTALQHMITLLDGRWEPRDDRQASRGRTS